MSQASPTTRPASIRHLAAINDLLLDRFPGQSDAVQTIVTALGELEPDARIGALPDLVREHLGIHDTTLLTTDAAVRVRLSDENARLKRLLEAGVVTVHQARDIVDELRKTSARASRAESVPDVVELVRRHTNVPEGATLEDLALTPSQVAVPPDPAEHFESYTSREDALLARLAVQMGFIDNESYRQALDQRARGESAGGDGDTGARRPFFKDILFREGLLSAGQVLDLFAAVGFFQEMKRDYLLARQGIQLGVLDQEAVMTCLKVQQFQFYHLHKAGPDNRLGALLVRLGFTRPDDLARLLEVTGQHARSSAAIRSSAELTTPSGRRGSSARQAVAASSSADEVISARAAEAAERAAAESSADTAGDSDGMTSELFVDTDGTAGASPSESPAADADDVDDDEYDSAALADQYISTGGTVRPHLPSHRLLDDDERDTTEIVPADYAPVEEVISSGQVKKKTGRLPDRPAEPDTADTADTGDAPTEATTDDASESAESEDARPQPPEATSALRTPPRVSHQPGRSVTTRPPADPVNAEEPAETGAEADVSARADEETPASDRTPATTADAPSGGDAFAQWEPPAQQVDDTSERLAGRRKVLEELKGSPAYAMHFAGLDKESRVLVQLLVLFENLPLVRLASAAREYKSMGEYGVSVKFADVLANLNLIPAARLDAVLRYRERAVITCTNDACDKMLTRRERTATMVECPACGSPFRATAEVTESGVFDPAATGKFIIEAEQEEDEDKPSWFGRFRLNEVADDGPVFIRFEGFDPEAARAVSIKLYHDPYREFVQQRLDKLFTRLSKLRHPAIEPVIETGELEDEPYLVMPSGEGTQTLDVLLVNRGTLEPGVIVDAMIEVCDGLEKAGRARVYHLDVRPARIVRKRSGHHWAIRDFEISRVRGRGPSLVSETVFGDPSYLAPELLVKGAKPDARVDVYGVGMTLYECVTGVLPFTDTDPRRLLQSIRTQTPQRPHRLNSEVTPDLSRLIMQCIAKNPDKRPADCGELGERLREVADDLAE